MRQSIYCASDGAPLLGPEHRQVGQALDQNPRGSRPSIAASARAGEMNARESVIRIERSLLPSRMASDSMDWVREDADVVQSLIDQALDLARKQGSLRHERRLLA
jgi:hypothetical protein